MTRTRNVAVLAAAVVVLTAVVTGSTGPAPAATADSHAPVALPPALQEAVAEAATSGELVEVEIEVDTPADAVDLRRRVAEAGGEVVMVDGRFARIRVPAGAVDTLTQWDKTVAMGVNQQLSLDAPVVALPNEPLAADAARRLSDINFEPLQVTQFRNQNGVSGKGVVVALVDSGVDAGHPDLQQTADGRPKIIDYKDFTGEGEVQTRYAVSWGTTYMAPDGRRYWLPARPAGSTGARFGYWEEYKLAGPYLGRDLDRNGSQTDRFGVLLVDANRPGVFDTVYVDTNNDGDFRDEIPLRLFSESRLVGRMGKPRDIQPTRQVNFVVAEVDPAGSFVRFGFDGYGHGTQVAGVLAGYSSDGLVGVAPDAQIMVLKALGSGGTGDWFAIKQAIRYAAQNGADIINVSVGGLAAAASRFDSTASDWLDEIAREYGVLIIIAADNTGPGLSSGATLGSPSDIMAVGAYYSPAMWMRDFGAAVPSEGIWYLSGMGPRSDGSYVPSVVAPGGSPAPSPYWIHNTGYTTAVGTSIATSHVSGVAALMIEAARKQGLRGDWLSVKRALEMGARPIAGYGVYEQGHGLVSPSVSLAHLQRIDAIPALEARSTSGGGGLLARSYAPGNTSFWLTNLDSNLARVGIFAEASWITPGSRTLTLPPGVARELSVQIDPPQTPGVHSAFLTITDPGKYGTALTIPVTYVRPIDLGGTGSMRYTRQENLEVARYKRYFFEVKPGTAALNVNVRVLLGPDNTPQGTLQVQVFRPDGDAIYSSIIGTAGKGTVAVLSTPDPVEGVWEVVVTAVPSSKDARLQAAYSLDVYALPGPLQGQPLRLNIEAGETAVYPLKIQNTLRTFTGRVEAMGLTLSPSGSLTSSGQGWRVVKGSRSLVEDFTLTSFTRRMRVEINHPVPSDLDLQLYLYYLDPQDGWVLRGQSVTPGISHEVIEVENLPAGRYQTLVVVSGSSPATYQYQYRRQTLPDGQNLVIQDEPAERSMGQSWTVNLQVYAPTQPGRYVGHILLRDTERNETLAWYPVEVSVGQPALSVEPMVAQLRQGQPSTVVLELRDGETRRLTDATITVNGRRYTSRNGRVSLSIVPEGQVAVLEVAADDPNYQFLRTEIRLPVRSQWGILPVGREQQSTLSWWRRKVLSQLP